VTGANAIVVAAAEHGVAVRSLRSLHNADLHEGDGLRTGLADVAAALWEAAGFGPGDVDAAYVYDDYPAVALIQLDELGLVPGGEVARFLRDSELPVNTSGGQLSAGQAGAAGGMHVLGEAVTQLLTGSRVEARRAVVSGYGMVLYRHGACASAAVLEAT
jgi:acetyl-CoA acetyltransferase